MSDDKRRGVPIPIGEIRWGSDAVNNAIEMRLAALIRGGHVKDEIVQAHEGEYLNEVCENLAAAVASMPAVQRAMSVALQSTDRLHCYNTVVRAIAKLFVIDPAPLIEKLKPGLAGSAPVFVPPRDPNAN